MRAYVMTSGAMFGLLVLAHILRIFAEGPGVVRDPFFMLSTAIAAALCMWAVRILRLHSRS